MKCRLGTCCDLMAGYGGGWGLLRCTSVRQIARMYALGLRPSQVKAGCVRRGFCPHFAPVPFGYTFDSNQPQAIAGVVGREMQPLKRHEQLVTVSGVKTFAVV